VRWYTPWIERVPSNNTLTLGTLDRRFKPAYEYRLNNAFSGGYPLLREVKLPDPSRRPDRWTPFAGCPQSLQQRPEVHHLLESGGQWVESPEEIWGPGDRQGPGNHSFAYFIPDDKYSRPIPNTFRCSRVNAFRPATTVSGLGLFHLLPKQPGTPPRCSRRNVIEWIRKTRRLLRGHHSQRCLAPHVHVHELRGPGA